MVQSQAVVFCFCFGHVSVSSQSEAKAPIHYQALSYDTGTKHSCYGSRQTLTSPSDSILSLMIFALARFLPEATHCLMVMSESVCCMTEPDSGLGPQAVSLCQSLTGVL